MPINNTMIQIVKFDRIRQFRNKITSWFIIILSTQNQFGMTTKVYKI